MLLGTTCLAGQQLLQAHAAQAVMDERAPVLGGDPSRQPQLGRDLDRLPHAQRGDEHVFLRMPGNR